jgi:hypothetical protein
MLALLALAVPARAQTFTGTLYFTARQGAADVYKIGFDYTAGSAPVLSNLMPIATLPKPPAEGGDGLVFTSDGALAVGGEGGAAFKVPLNGGPIQQVSVAGTNVFHMMAAPDGTIYSGSGESGLPGFAAKFNSTLTGTGTRLTQALGSSTPLITSIAWDKNGNSFYTSDDGDLGDNGTFGRITFPDPTHYLTTQKKGPQVGIHALFLDPFSNTLIASGDSEILQFDTSDTDNPMMISQNHLPSNARLDQGASDGKGHIFIADNLGAIWFLDISKTGRVEDAKLADNTLARLTVGGGISPDDLAPLVGPGSPPIEEVPEPATIVLLGVGSVILVGYGWRRRHQVA